VYIAEESAEKCEVESSERVSVLVLRVLKYAELVSRDRKDAEEMSKVLVNIFSAESVELRILLAFKIVVLRVFVEANRV
jgi:hypothetical protein